MFREQWQTKSVDGVQTRVIERTVYSETVINRTEVYSRPIVRTYLPGEFVGVPYYVYQPVTWTPAFYSFYDASLAQPFVASSACDICPPPVVTYSDPVEAYTDPLELVGDLQISSAVLDVTPSADQTAQASPEMAELRTQVADLQSQVDKQQASNPELHEQLVADIPNSGEARTATVRQKRAAAATYTVPDDVRQQIHQQVRDNVQLHQDRRALTWQDVVASGQAPLYVFQVSATINAADSNGEQCELSGGDMLRLNEGAEPLDAVLRMRVVASKGTSCETDTVVNIGVADAQSMLNDFNSRQESIMQKVQSQLVAKSH